MTWGGRRNLLESRSTDKIIKGIKKKKKTRKDSEFFFFSRMTEHSYDLSSTHPLALYGAFTFFFHCLLSYSDVEEKEVESNSLQPSARLICRTKETCFSFLFFFLNKATGKEFAMDGFACGTETRGLEEGFPWLCLLSGGGGGGGGGGGVGGVGGGHYWMSEWIFTDVALW